MFTPDRPLSLRRRPPSDEPHSDQNNTDPTLNHAPPEVSMDIDSSDRFIATEPTGAPGEAGEKRVWDAVRAAFGPRPQSFGFWRYPVFSKVGQRFKEPDIVVVDRECSRLTSRTLKAKRRVNDFHQELGRTHLTCYLQSQQYFLTPGPGGPYLRRASHRCTRRPTPLKFLFAPFALMPDLLSVFPQPGSATRSVVLYC
jgi:hypothetical protein